MNKIKIYGYKFLRNLYKMHIAYTTDNFKRLNRNDFLIKYTDVRPESVQLVAETANEIIEPVNSFFNFTPREKISVIIYPSMEALNQSFGWEGDKSPMGVYWMGTIRVLAPETWIIDEDDKDKSHIFKTMGPMAHEYTHLVVDYKTNGNYTRWFTEGIAQYVEKKLTGFTLDEPTEEAKLDIYSFQQLDREFDQRQNQELAYWQSLLAIEYLVDNHGEQVISQLLTELAQGKSLNKAFVKVTGEDLMNFEKNIKNYVKKQLPINLP